MPESPNGVPAFAALGAIAEHLREIPSTLLATHSCVYLLFKDDQVVYVGQSINALGRISQHLRLRDWETPDPVGFPKMEFGFDRAYFLPVPREDLNAVEAALIMALKPRYNGDRDRIFRGHDFAAVAAKYLPGIAAPEGGWPAIRRPRRPKGAPSVARHSDPHWRDKFHCYTYTYRRHRHYLRGIAHGDMASVWKAVAKIREETDAAEAALREPTVHTLGCLYLVWSGTHNSFRTTVDHEAMLRRFCAFGDPPYGTRPAREIRATDLARMRAEWEKAGYGPAYVQRLYKTILACWAWAARPEPDRGEGLPEKLLEVNTLAGLRRPRATGRTERYTTRTEVAALLKAGWKEANRPWRLGTKGRCLACTRAGREGPCRRSHAVTARMDRDTVLLVRLLRATGARPGELCVAQWTDWTPRVYQDPVTGSWWGLIRLDPERHKTGRATGRARKIAVPPLLARALERVRNRASAHPDHARAIFNHRRAKGAEARGSADAAAGEPWRVGALGHRVRRWRAAASAAGCPLPADLSLYTLRHTWYTDAAPIVGADAAGQAGGTSGAVVRAVYMAHRDEAVIATARAARARRHPPA